MEVKVQEDPLNQMAKNEEDPIETMDRMIGITFRAVGSYHRPLENKSSLPIWAVLGLWTSMLSTPKTA